MRRQVVEWCATAAVIFGAADAFTPLVLLNNAPAARPNRATSLTMVEPPVIGRRAALLSFAVAGGSLLMPPSKAHADDLPSELAENKLIQILQDAKSLGNVRFTSVNTFGSVLEGVGRLDFAASPFEIPMGTKGMVGQYIRFSGPNSGDHLIANFECSINVDNAEKVQFVELNGPLGPLYCMRILDANNNKIMTIALNYDVEASKNKAEGIGYAKGQVEAFQALRKKWGDNVTIRG